MDYSYASEKFDRARSNLMLPHPQGEASSIMWAFHECHLGLNGVNPSNLPEQIRGQVTKLLALMDTTGIQHGNEGAWMAKAETFDNEQKRELSSLVDELCYWFGELADGNE
jgi:hypothetical protein